MGFVLTVKAVYFLAVSTVIILPFGKNTQGSRTGAVYNMTIFFISYSFVSKIFVHKVGEFVLFGKYA